jgi:hypothetical protein
VPHRLARDHAVRIIAVNPGRKHPDLGVATELRDREASFAACRGFEAWFNLTDQDHEAAPEFPEESKSRQFQN